MLGYTAAEPERIDRGANFSPTMIRPSLTPVTACMTIAVSIVAPACHNNLIPVSRTIAARHGEAEERGRMGEAARELTKDEVAKLLVAVGRDRDVEAFERLFRYYGPRVKAYMARLAHNSQAAEELMQETMMTVWNKAAQFDPSRGNVATWIFTIARNLRVDAYRKDRRPDFDPNDPAFVPDNAAAADAAFENVQEAERLRRAMEELPEEQLQLLKLSFFDDRSHSTIAEQLNIPLGTVKSRIRLAFAKLRTALEEKA
ncbi:sigma-70 family RNA polymerase sigma factor [Ferirhizobium litorale]|nr:sigma-70 family RNA polymerase sigma factor [Fererhizobium litorale]